MSLNANILLERDDFQLDVKFEIERRGVTALFGPSGAGKSTLLRTICGLERPQRARIQFNSEIWNDSSQKIFLAPHRRPVGYVVQGAGLFAHLDVQGNLDYAQKRATQRRVSSDEMIELMGIEKFLTRKIHTLSGGERQRVAIARALLTSPQLLLLDEPLAALDHQRKREILPYLENLHAELNIPVIYVSHAIDEVARIADQMLLIEHGQIRAQGPIQELLTELDQPLTQGSDAAALLVSRVVSLDAAFSLLGLEFSGGRLSIPHHDSVEVGDQIRVSIRADDVSLVLDEPTGTSILNVIPVEVVEISPDPNSNAQMLVKLRAGDDFLLSRITRKSAEGLDVRVGMKLFAQVKSVALVG